MHYTHFGIEQHIQQAIDRIAEDREATMPLHTGAPSLVESTRRRVGSLINAIGERVGGPAVRTPRPVAPRPSHTPLLSF